MSNKASATPGMIRILIVDDVLDTRENLKKLLAFESNIEVVGTAGTGREAIEIARVQRPDIVIMDINMPDMDGIQATEQITRAAPAVGVIMLSVQSEPEYFRRAMLAGARDFLAKPVSGDELYTTIQRVYDKRPVDVYIKADPQRGGEGGAPATGDSGALRKPGSGLVADRYGKILAVYSPQGGVGKTTVATNLALALMRENVKVLLIDASFQFGDVATVLDLKSNNTILDLLKTGIIEDVDVDLVESVLVRHATGLRVLLPPSLPQDAESIQPATFEGLLKQLKLLFDFIVVDTSSALNEINLKLFDNADRIILVAHPTLNAAKNIRLMLNVMDAIGYPESKSVLVFNRVNPDYERNKVVLSVKQIEDSLKRKALISIPMDDQKVMYAQTRGVPLFAGKDRNSSPAREFLALADALNTVLRPAPRPSVADLVPETKQPAKSGGGLFRRG